jgi:hypothetical protein
MKQIVKKLGRRAGRLLGIEPPVNPVFSDRDSCASKLSQLLLAQQYRSLAHAKAPLPAFADVEFRAFSQNGEEGILLFLFALLGAGRRRAVEICASNGIECNAANLVINHGWEAMLFDGDAENIQRGKAFYAGHPDTFSLPPRFVHAWITRENINQLIRENGFAGEIDLLSLDIDGIDYHLWEALDAVNPRVVVAETQCVWGAERAVTVPYDPNFRGGFVNGYGIYSGASLPAFVRLAARKGYRLVGVQRFGYNAFFVRNGLGEDLFPKVEPSACLDLPFVHWAKQNLLPLVKDKPWVEV